MSCDFFFPLLMVQPQEQATKLITFVERKCLNDNLFQELTTNCSAFSLFMPQSSQGVQIEVLKNMTASVFSFSMKFSLQTYAQSFIHNPVQIVIHDYYSAGSQDALIVEDSSQ